MAEQVKREGVREYKNRLRSVGAVESAASDLDDERCIGESFILKVFGVLNNGG